MASTQRFTVETLASGQPRPYADHLWHVRVSFESTDFQTGELAPRRMDEASARRYLKALPCAFTELTRADKRGKGEDAHYQTHLDWLKPIDGIPASEAISHGDPNQTVASVWEFQTTTPFTD